MAANAGALIADAAGQFLGRRDKSGRIAAARLDPYLKDNAMVEGDKRLIASRVSLRQSDGAAVRRGKDDFQMIGGGDACLDDAP